LCAISSIARIFYVVRWWRSSIIAFWKPD
jgi:hypothetical protein